MTAETDTARRTPTPRQLWRKALFGSDLPTLDKLTLLALADWAKPDGETFRTVPDLADDTSASRATIYRVLARVQAAGWLVEMEPARGRRATRYRLTDPAGRGSHGGTPTATEAPAVEVSDRDPYQAVEVSEGDPSTAVEVSTGDRGVSLRDVEVSHRDRRGLTVRPEVVGGEREGGESATPPAPAVLAYPRQCPSHQGSEHLDPCRACGDARRANNAVRAEASRGVTRPRPMTPVDRRNLIDPEVCVHGGRAGFLPSGKPMCPHCRNAAGVPARAFASAVAS